MMIDLAIRKKIFLFLLLVSRDFESLPLMSVPCEKISRILFSITINDAAFKMNMGNSIASVIIDSESCNIDRQ